MRANDPIRAFSSGKPDPTLPQSALCNPNIGEKGVDFRTQDVGFATERAGRAQHLAGRRSGFSRGGADADDVAGNLAGAAGGVLDVAGDLARRHALLFDRGRDRSSHLVDLADGLTDVSDGADRGSRRPLHAGDLRLSLLGSLRGLVGEA